MEDAKTIHAMQVRAFRGLLEKYRDYATNPAAEPVEKVISRMQMENSRYYFIMHNGAAIGALRVQDKGAACRLSPIYILPEYQGRGYAQQAMLLAEKLYPHASRWQLDTIGEEPKLCHLYEKLGYVKSGKTTQLKPDMTIVDYEKNINLKG